MFFTKRRTIFCVLFIIISLFLLLQILKFFKRERKLLPLSDKKTQMARLFSLNSNISSGGQNNDLCRGGNSSLCGGHMGYARYQMPQITNREKMNKLIEIARGLGYNSNETVIDIRKLN